MSDLLMNSVIAKLEAKVLRQEAAVKETKAHIAALELLQKQTPKK